MGNTQINLFLVGDFNIQYVFLSKTFLLVKCTEFQISEKLKQVQLGEGGEGGGEEEGGEEGKEEKAGEGGEGRVEGREEGREEVELYGKCRVGTQV